MGTSGSTTTNGSTKLWAISHPASCLGPSIRLTSGMRLTPLPYLQQTKKGGGYRTWNWYPTHSSHPSQGHDDPAGHSLNPAPPLSKGWGPPHSTGMGIYETESPSWRPFYATSCLPAFGNFRKLSRVPACVTAGAISYEVLSMYLLRKSQLDSVSKLVLCKGLGNKIDSSQSPGFGLIFRQPPTGYDQHWNCFCIRVLL